MNRILKQGVAVFLNLAMLTNQLSADLQQITFDSAEWVPYQTVGQTPGTGWNLVSGSAAVSAQGAGAGGGRALSIPANATGETRITREIPWDPAEQIAFVDLKIKPAANPENSLSNIVTNGTQIAFQVPEGSNTGEIWVYQGNDGAETRPEEWVRTAGVFNVPNGATSADGYVRLTLRHDYVRNIWDLFIDGKLAAANLSFDGRAGNNLQSVDFFGSEAGDTLIDDIAALKDNMLFPDADKDGLPDAWEIANGSNPNVYDRDSIKPGTGKSFMDTYMDSLWPHVSGRGGASFASGGTIPALSLPTHQPVGALKGAFSVGSDGAANYSIPIDLPKGTAGMEPKLSLAYSSNSGNGPLGVGWSLTGLQKITRGPSSAMKDGAYDPMDFDGSDRFFLDGERLIRVAGAPYGMPDSEYRTEIDSYARIKAHGEGSSIAYWTVETKAGLKIFLGGSDDVNYSELSVGAGKLAWCVNKVMDTSGNYYTVEYLRGDNNDFNFVDHRVNAIHYTGNGAQDPYCHVNFDYEDRPDDSRSFTKYAASRMTKRLSKIRVGTSGTPNHSYVFSYHNSYQSGRSFLDSVTKLVPATPGAEPTIAVPPTTFNYDGITASESLWRDPGLRKLPVYGVNLDATSEVNSMVDVTDADTTIRLAGDVARAYKLPGSGVTLNAGTRIRFDFRSTKQVSGAIIGLDADTTYQSSASTALYRIGGTGTIDMSGGLNFIGPTRSYTGSDWVSYDLPIGNLGTGTRGYLVLMCVDNDVSDGVDNAFFRNVRFVQGSTPVTGMNPILFDVDTQLPRYADSNGKDLGVRTLDLDSDGLPDLADWRAFDYDTTNGCLTPETFGNVFRNTGEDFVRDTGIRPPTFLPLSTRSTDGVADEYESKHHLTASPSDVDGDGRLDLLGSVNIKSTTGYIENEYSFYSLVNGTWAEKTAWKLPFYSDNIVSSEGRGGKRRDEHFRWMDLNSDGFQDLVVYTTSSGRLYDRVTNALILGGNASIAYLNKGKSGAGWIRDNSLYLPVPLMENGDDEGRRIVDLDGDGVPEIAQARYISGNLYQRTHFLNPTGAYRWSPPNAIDTAPPDAYDLPSGLLISSGHDRGVLMLDLNGDGMVDVLRAQKESGVFTRKTWLNRGRGHGAPWIGENVPTNAAEQKERYDFPYPLQYESNAYDSTWRVPYGFQVTDVNGDGLQDIIYSDIENTETSGVDNLTFLNTGNGWDKRPEWGLPEDYRIYKDASERFDSKRRAKLEDLNGDGFPDLITGLIDLVPRVWYNNCRPEVLMSATDGFGSELQVEYHRLNDPTPTGRFGTRVYTPTTEALPEGQAAVMDSRLVVSRYSEPNGSAGRRSRCQRYGDLRYDRYNEASLGFGWVEVVDELTYELNRTVTSQVYPFAGSPIHTESSVVVAGSDIVPGDPAKPPTTGRKVISIEDAEYVDLTPTGNIRRPVQTKSIKTLKEHLSGVIVSQTTTTQSAADFDAFGFVKKSIVSTLDGSTVTTTSSYNNIVTNDDWLLGRLTTSTVTKSGGGKAILTRSSSFSYDTDGLLASETIESGNAISLTKTYDRDGFGNIVATHATGKAHPGATATETRSSSSIYSERGRFMEQETNAMGHTIKYDYDPDRALLKSTTDPNNFTTRFEYDAFGTLIRTCHPDGTETGEATGFATNASLPTGVSSYLNGSIQYFRAKQSSGAPVVKVYLDALGRELANETTILTNANASGSSRYTKVYSVTNYDSRGRKTRVSGAFAAGETPKFTEITYDTVNRVLSTLHPDGKKDTLALSAIDGAGGASPITHSNSKTRDDRYLERWEDQHGRLVKSIDQAQSIAGGATVFTHDQDGRLLTATVNGEKLIDNTYDIFGNKTVVWEKNSGTSTSIYNAFGEVVSTTNANNAITTTTYDAIGRPVSVSKEEGQYQFFYDGPFGKGKPASTTGPDGYSDSVFYDSLGRPYATRKIQFGEIFTTFTTYDGPLGRVLAETDAGGLTVIHEYDPLYSFPTALKLGPGTEGAGTVLWKAGTFNSKGQPIAQTLAQGVTTSRIYDPDSDRVTYAGAMAAGVALQGKTYEWTTSGNLGKCTDAVASRTETYTYDVNRLIRAESSVTGGGGVISSPYGYDSGQKGNLISKPGANLVYGDTAHPHRVTASTLKGVSHTYAYDAAGYMKKDSVGTDARRDFTWTSYGQLKTLDYKAAPSLQDFAGTVIYAASRVQTDFDFDAAGNRVRQIKEHIAADDSRLVEQTLYLGSYERESHGTKAASGSSTYYNKTVHRHSIGGFAVYTRTEKPGLPDVVKLSTLLKDHLGSTDVILTGTWNGASFANPQTERQSFDAWGERRDPATFANYRATDSAPYRTSAQDYDRGYTGHEQLDDSGLIHMNGRIYDPELGRMLSPDPYVQVPEYSQNFNRYSYVMNNPLNLTDPSGYSWVGDVFHKMGSWLSQNWRQVVVIVVMAVLTYFTAGAASAWGAGVYASATGTVGAAAGSAAATAAATFGQAVAGAYIGAVAGGLSTALNGGDAGDVLRGAVVGGISGALAGALHGVGDTFLGDAANIVGHGVIGGASNVAIGGKFGDGFLSASASAATGVSGLTDPETSSLNFAGRTTVAAVAGGTASAIGGGKFANGAVTGAFHHLVNAEAKNWRHLTKGEISLAKQVFGNLIDYQTVHIFSQKYMPAQFGNYTITPNGNLYVPPGSSQDVADFSNSTLGLMHHFLHEMVHVWQYQHGVNVLKNGILQAGSYKYTPLVKGRVFSKYTIEQQASMVSDYWALKRYGVEYQINSPSIMEYEKLIPFKVK